MPLVLERKHRREFAWPEIYIGCVLFCGLVATPIIPDKVKNTAPFSVFLYIAVVLCGFFVAGWTVFRTLVVIVALARKQTKTIFLYEGLVLVFVWVAVVVGYFLNLQKS
jgi:hypothetical protein